MTRWTEDAELQAAADAAMERWALQDLEEERARFDAEEKQERRIAAMSAHDDGFDHHDPADRLGLALVSPRPRADAEHLLY